MDDALSLDLIKRNVGATTKICGKEENVTRRDVRATQNGILQMCHLICAETEKILTHTHSSLENELILLNLQTLQCTRHSFLPDPLCPVCSNLPDDTADAAAISLQPSLKQMMQHIAVVPFMN